MSFTPGPWSVNANSEQSDPDKLSVEIGDGAYFICQVDGGIHQKANARLIAAAPELLEALESLFDDYKQLADSGDCGCWLLEDQEVGKKALAVIAKARGEHL